MKRIKAFFSFTRREQYGFVVLFALIFIVIVLNFFIGKIPPEPPDEALMAAWNEEVVRFEQTQIAAAKQEDSLKQAYRYRQENLVKERSQRNFSNQHYGREQTKLFYFDPNILALEGFVELGFSQKQAQVILNYREKGGVFRTKDDFKKSFVVSDEMFAILEPWLLLPEATSGNEYTQKEHFTIELNTADTTDLKQIHGIGSVLAERIIRHRERLGGFCYSAQLLEVNGIDKPLWEKTLPHIVIDTTRIERFDLNNCEFKQLARHPYFEHYIVKALFEYKDKKGRFSSVEELKELPVMYDALYDTLAPYLYVSPKH